MQFNSSKMSNKKNITRREALKKMGVFAAGAALSASAIILGSPTYSADVSSVLKAVIERASVVTDTNPGLFRHKVAGAVAVARRAGAMNVIDTMNHFFLNKEMYLAGSTYWNIGRLPGEAKNDEEGVANMKNLGQNIAWLLNRLR